MAAPRRKFKRPFGERRYRKKFVIAAEGVKTEPQYFSIFNKGNAVIRVQCIKGSNKSSPPQVLERMRKFLRQEGLRKEDEAWLVVDNDQWTVEQLQELHEWSKKLENRGFAVSNPKFEFWLLLHFEEGKSLASVSDCSKRLKRHLPDYDKGIKWHVFTAEKINEAIQRAKVRDDPPCEDWPRKFGNTTIYRLVEKIMKEQ